MQTATNIQHPATSNQIVVAALYKFAKIKNPAKLQKQLKEFMLARDVKGTIIVAPEGVNGTISGSREGIDETLEFIRKVPGFADIDHKESFFTEHPFGKTKVKHKKELIGLGVKADPTEKVGKYVDSEEWNKLLEEGIPVIDTRNEYEVIIGTFEGAIDPKTKRFKELPKWTEENIDPKKHKRVAMFCTGGIRCEKYSSYVMGLGVEEVFHLKGGILKYLEDMPVEKSKWNGSCYVFDERVAVGHGLEPSGEADRCPSCGHTIWTKDRIKEDFVLHQRCSFCPD